MTARHLTTALLLAHLAAALTGSTSASFGSGSGQRFVDSLNIKNVSQQTLDRLTRDAQEATVEDYAEETFGFSREDLQKLDAGIMIVPKTLDVETLSPDALMSQVAEQKDKLSAERTRAKQAVQTSVEAIAQQQYLEGMHDSLSDSYEEAYERSVERMKEQIKQVQSYYQKFPSICTACT